MERRQFIASAIAAPAIYAGLKSSMPAAGCQSDNLPLVENFPQVEPSEKIPEVEPEESCQTDKVPPARGRARVAIVTTGDWFSPRRWSDVPDGGNIIELSEPTSYRDARQRVKWFNTGKRKLRNWEWAIVVASDGRKLAKERAQDENIKATEGETITLYLTVIRYPNGESKITGANLTPTQGNGFCDTYNQLCNRGTSPSKAEIVAARVVIGGVV